MRGVVKGGNNNGGGSGSDGITKSYSVETGETVIVNDAVEFVNNKVKKTKVVSVPGSATPQRLISNASSTGTFNMRVTDTTGILFTRSSVSSGQTTCTPYTLVGSTMNLGTPLELTSTTEVFDAKFIDSNVIAVFHYLSSTIKGIHLIQYDNGALTLLNTLSITQGTTYSGRIVPLGAREFLLVWTTGSTSDRASAQYYKVATDNVTLTMGTKTVILSSGNANTHYVDVVRTSSGRIAGVVGESDAAGIPDFYPFELSVSPLGVITVVQGRLYTETVIRISGTGMRVCALSNDRILFVGGFNGTSDYGKAIVFDLNGLTVGPRIALTKTGPKNPMIETCDLANPDRVVVLSGYTTIYSSILVVNADNTITEVSYKELTSYTSYPVEGNYNQTIHGYLAKNMFTYITGTSSNDRELFMISTENNECNLTVTKATQPMGIVKGVSGGIATVALKNSVLSGLSGLTPGALYYCDANGNITLNANTGLVTHTPIGRAISTTEILLTKLSTFFNFNLGSSNVLKNTYTTSGAVTIGRVVMLNSNGTITNYNGTGLPLGVYAGNGIVYLKGIVTGLSGLLTGQKYWFGSDGSLTTNDIGGKNILGYGLSATELLVPDYIIDRY